MSSVQGLLVKSIFHVLIRCSVSDGLRAIHLRPGIVEGHICYILSLSASGRMDEVNLASEDFYKRFPKDRLKLKRALEQCEPAGVT